MIQYGGDVGTSKTVFGEITLTMKSVLLNYVRFKRAITVCCHLQKIKATSCETKIQRKKKNSGKIKKNKFKTK